MSPQTLRNSLVSLTLGITILAGCDLFDSDKGKKGKVSNAAVIIPGEAVTVIIPGDMDERDTVDLTFQADSGFTYRFSFEGYIVEQTIRSADGTLQITRSVFTGTDMDSLTFPCAKGGTYTVQVIDFGTSQVVIGSSVSKGLPSWFNAPDSYESDNRLSASKSIGSDSVWQRRTLHNSSTDYTTDQDWISLKVDSGRTYNVQIIGGTSTPSFAAYDKDSMALPYSSSSISLGSTNAQSRKLEIIKSGTIHLRLAGTFATAYQVAVTSAEGISGSSVGDKYESDNNLSTAKSIGTDSVWQVRSLNGIGTTSSTDQDWISVKVDSGRTYSVYFRGEKSTPIFAAYDKDSLSLGYTSTYVYLGSDYTQVRKIEIAKSGTIYLKMSGSTPTAYQIAVTSVSGISAMSVQDAYESDNNLSTAKSIGTDSVWQSRSLNSSGSTTTADQDWIAVKVDSGRTYSVLFRGEQNTPVFSAYDKDSLSVVFTTTSVYLGTDLTQVRKIEVGKSGTIYLKMAGSYATAYRIAVTSVSGITPSSVQDGFESDNSLSTAKSIGSDSVYQSRSLHGLGSSYTTDQDWISVKVDSGMTYTVYYQYTTSSPSLAVYDKDSVALNFTSDSRTIGSTYFLIRRIEIAKSGTMYLRFYGSYAAGYSVAVVAKAGISAAAIRDAYESDNSIATAKTILPDSSWQSRTIHLGSGVSDPDIVSFLADSGKTYRVQYIDTSMDITAVAYSADSASILARDSAVGSREMLVIPCTKTGKIHVRFFTNYGYTTAYRIALTSSAGLPSWGVPDPGEPDHGLSTAMLGISDSSAIQRVLQGNDTDWVRVPVLKNRIYTFRVTNLSTTTSLYAYLLDSTGKSLNSYSVSYGGAYFSNLVHEATTDGVVYVRVQQTSTFATSVVPYVLRLSFVTQIPDDLEPDNSMTFAVSVPSDKPAITRTVRYVDEDWMKIAVDSGRAVKIFGSTLPSSASSVAFQLFTRDSVLANSSTAYYSGGSTTFSYTPRYSGFMYVRTSTTSTLNVGYTFRVENFPKDTTEPNDGISNARPISADSTWTSTVLLGADVDWFKVSLVAGVIYRIEMNADYSSDLAIFSADSVRLDYLNGSTVRTLIHRAKTDGDLFIKTNLYSTTGTTPSAARIAVSAVPDDEDEPMNNTLAGATPIKTDSTVLIRRTLLTDPDFVTFLVDSGKSYQLTGNATSTIVFTIYNKDSLQVFSSLGPSAVFAPKTSGRHFLRVANSSSLSLQTWGLSVLEVSPDSFENDDVLSRAKAIPTDGVPQARQLMPADVDWISVAVDSGVVYTIGVIANSTLYTQVFTEDSLVYASASYVAPSTSPVLRTFTPRRKGVFYIRVYPYSGGFSRYQIHVSKPELP